MPCEHVRALVLIAHASHAHHESKRRTGLIVRAQERIKRGVRSACIVRKWHGNHIGELSRGEAADFVITPQRFGPGKRTHSQRRRED